MAASLQDDPSTLVILASWYSRPCIVPSHIEEADMFRQWAITETTECDFWSEVRKDVVTFTLPSWITLEESGHQVLKILKLWKDLREEELWTLANNQHHVRELSWKQTLLGQSRLPMELQWTPHCTSSETQARISQLIPEFLNHWNCVS